MGAGQTIGGVSSRGWLHADSDQLGNHGSPASLPRRLSRMFPRTGKINLRNMECFCARQKINRRTQMFLRAPYKKSAQHNVFARTWNLFLRPTNFIMRTPIISVHIKGSITKGFWGQKKCFWNFSLNGPPYYSWHHLPSHGFHLS